MTDNDSKRLGWLPGDPKPMMPPPSERMDTSEAYALLTELAQP